MKSDVNFSSFTSLEKIVASLELAFPKLSSAISGTVTALGGMGTVGPILAVVAAVGVAVSVFNSYKKSLEEAVSSATEAASAWSEENSSIEDYAARIEELRTSLDSGTLSEEEAYEAKTELLQIQNELGEAYGYTSGQLDLLNGSLEQQLDLVNSISESTAGEFLTQNKKGIDEAAKQMEKLRSYTTQFLSNGDMDSVAALEEIVDKYDGLSLDTDNNGLYTLTFTGDASQATEVMNGVSEDIRALEDKYGETNILDGVLDFSSETANSAQDILDTYQELYDNAKLAELITDTTTLQDLLSDGLEFDGSYADLYEEYAQAVSDYNDALLSGDTSQISAAKTEFEGVQAVVDDLSANDDLGGFSSCFDEVAASLDTSTAALYEFNDALEGDLQDDLEAIEGWSTEKLNYQIEALAAGSDDADESLKNLVDSARELGVVSGEEGEYTTEQINEAITALENLGYTFEAVADEASVSMDDLEANVTAVQTVIENLNTALDESVSATGISAESLSLIEAAFSDLDGYDASALFEQTANGIHLNRDELEKLNEEYESKKMSEFTDALETLEGQLADANTELANCTEGTEEYDAALSNVESIENQIQETELLITQYKGLTSAYNDFVNAQSASDERDAYSNIGGSYEDLNELVEAGWVGDTEIEEYLDLLIAADKRTGDNYEDWKLLTKTIDGANYSLMDFFQYDSETGDLTVNGLANFIDTIDKLCGEDIVSVADDGSFALDLTGDKLSQVAEALGTTEEFVELIGQAMIDAGIDVKFNDAAESSSTLANEVQEAKAAIEETTDAVEDAVDALREMGELDDFSYNLNAELDGEGGIAEQLEAAKEALTENDEIKFEADTDEYKNALTLLTALTQRQQELENADRAVMQIDTTQASSDVNTLISDLQTMQTQFDNYELNMTVGADTSEAEERIVQYAGEVQTSLGSLDTEVIAELGLDDEDFQAALERVANTDVEAGAEVDQADIDIIQSTLDGISAEALVSVGLADSSTTAQQELEDIQTSVETLNAAGDVTVNVTINTTGADTLATAKADVESLKESASTTVGGTIKWGNDTVDVEKYASVQKQGTGVVNWSNNESAVNTYAKKMKYANGTVNWGNNTTNVKTKFYATGTVNWSGTAGAIGTAHASGTAKANGDWGLRQSEDGALTGELGRELIVDPYSGKWYTVGDNGAEFVKLPKDAIVFNHKQTEEIFKYGKINTRGQALAEGTAHYTASGTLHTSSSSTVSASSKSSSSSSSSSKKSSSSSSSSSKKSSSSSSSSSTKETIDWIEIAVSRLERTIENLGQTATATYKTLSKRLSASASEISKVTEEISLQTDAYNRYMQEANSVGLSSSLKKKVQNGTIDISDYSESTAEKIKEYQEWWKFFVPLNLFNCWNALRVPLTTTQS